MRTLSKYKRFLEDRDLYVKNQAFWKGTFTGISEHSFEDWVITTFANGEDFFDGNPIASAWYPDLNKAVRIIQISSDLYAPLVKAWIEDVEYWDRLITELVLVVQPSDRAYDSVINILTFFLTNQDMNVVRSYVQDWNTFHKRAVSLNQPASTLQKVNPYDINSKLDDTIKAIYKKASTRKKPSKKLS